MFNSKISALKVCCVSCHICDVSERNTFVSKMCAIHPVHIFVEDVISRPNLCSDPSTYILTSNKKTSVWLPKCFCWRQDLFLTSIIKKDSVVRQYFWVIYLCLFPSKNENSATVGNLKLSAWKFVPVGQNTLFTGITRVIRFHLQVIRLFTKEIPEEKILLCVFTIL